MSSQPPADAFLSNQIIIRQALEFYNNILTTIIESKENRDNYFVRGDGLRIYSLIQRSPGATFTKGELVLFTYPIVGELPKSSVIVDIIKSLDAPIELTLPVIEYVISNAPMNDAPEDIIYEYLT